MMNQTTKNENLATGLVISTMFFIAACGFVVDLFIKYNDRYPALQEILLNTETTTYRGIIVPDTELFSPLGKTLNLAKHRITNNHYYVGLLFKTESNELKEVRCDEPPLRRTSFSGPNYQRQKTVSDSCWWLLNKAAVQNKQALITVNKYNYLYGVEVDGKKILDKHQAYSLYQQELEHFFPPLSDLSRRDNRFLYTYLGISIVFFIFYLILFLRSKR